MAITINVGLVLVCCILLPSIYASDEYVVVQSESGPIRGKSAITLFEDKQYYAFKGIPYAEAPTGVNRFKVFFF